MGLQSIRRLGRKSTLCLGLLTLSFSTLGFGLSKSIPLWCITRILQGAGSAAAGQSRLPACPRGAGSSRHTQEGRRTPWTLLPQSRCHSSPWTDTDTPSSPSSPSLLRLSSSGATYYAILSDMYPDTLGLIIGIQEAVTGLGYMVGPMLGAGLFALGGFRLPFLALGAFPLAVCLMLPPLLRNAHNFEPSHNIPGYGSPSLLAHQQQGSSSTDEEEEEEDAVSVEEQDRLHPPPPLGGGDKMMMPPLSLNDMMHHQDLQDDQGRLKAGGGGGWCWSSSSPYLSLPFVFVSLGTTLATCGFAFLEPVLSEHLMTQLHVSTSMSGLLMGVPSVTYIVAAPLGGWLGEVCGYRPILFLGFLIFAVGLALVGPMPLIPPDVDASLTWAIQVGRGSRARRTTTHREAGSSSVVGPAPTILARRERALTLAPPVRWSCWLDGMDGRWALWPCWAWALPSAPSPPCPTSSTSPGPAPPMTWPASSTTCSCPPER